MSIIVALSGGKASAWCADFAFKNYNKDEIILYFNDTKWEHEDLYRFLNDISKHYNHPITYDSDGRSPEDLFYDNNALANNRMPFCSRILKADRLQKFYKDGDTILFGISSDEEHRAKRIIEVYRFASLKKSKTAKIAFPLIENNINSLQIDSYLKSIGIEQPLLYKLGFKHNNCSGGCVRAGKKHWKLLYEKLPQVYLERERVEREMRDYTEKNISFFKDETLEEFRGRIDRKELSAYYYSTVDKEVETECIGVCSTES